MQILEQPLQFLKVNVLREYLQWEFADLTGFGKTTGGDSFDNPSEQDDWSGPSGEAGGKEKESKTFDFERILEDFVLLTFMVGTSHLLLSPEARQRRSLSYPSSIHRFDPTLHKVGMQLISILVLVGEAYFLNFCRGCSEMVSPLFTQRYVFR